MKKFYEKVCKLEELIALILVAGIAVLVFVSALMRTIGTVSQGKPQGEG